MLGKYKYSIIGICLGGLYGLLARLYLERLGAVATPIFFFLVPALIGLLSLLITEREKLKSFINWIMIPWLSIMSFFLITFACQVEDFACLIIIAAPFVVVATIVAVIVRFIQINKRNKKRLLSLLALPFLIAPFNQYINTPSEVYQIKNTIEIQAPESLIWNNIVRVDLIQEDEYKTGLFHYMGIPRPLKAELDSCKIGGKRIGYFSNGLRFEESVVELERNQHIKFTIELDTSSTGNRIFDQHVLAGNYFSFVDAEYNIISQAGNSVTLELTSKYRLNSQINYYGELWGNAILEDFQQRLLETLKLRIENKSIK